MKINGPARKTIIILNKNRSNTSYFRNCSPKLSSQLSKEYYERLVLNNDVGFMTMIRVISFWLVKRVAYLSVDELKGLEVDQKGFIIEYEALSQLVKKSQKLFQA